ncbi:murein biosynthesis integral membrane protein MurJ [bacterium endosymbiont of Pedicinus badii]|uniref:murein biosynthesis integral membrane protein MurJ n=1 Tax=bacterium endosymbiont of Pedicinus badii TaxID=1719126 RepID=UPI0009BBB42A|nr:murein biosynthesis integral membrane protein MurJ [bacterium endosymbiont of Pedicinus badii]OQM34434.1 hypothetical protein AOQ89_00905 [bacterium endosymbiont of Pedicinus badii]
MNLIKKILQISITILFSRISGFVRDVCIANYFGTTPEIGIFFIAFKIPNFLRKIFAEGAFFQAFFPIFIEYKKNNSHKKTKKFFSLIFGWLLLILVIISITGVIFSSVFLFLLAPGILFIYKQYFDLANNLIKIVFPYLVFISLSCLFNIALYAWKKLFIPVISPFFLNFSIVCFILFFYPFHLGEETIFLSFSVLFGGILQCLYQIPFLKKIDMLVFPKIEFHKDAFLVFQKTCSGILVSIVPQISYITSTIIFSFLVPNSISWIYYTERIIEIPCGILCYAITVILLPYLSRLIQKKNYSKYYKTIQNSIKIGAICTIPVSIAVFTLSFPIVVCFFQYGKFSYFDSFIVSKFLKIASIGIFFTIVYKILLLGFISRKDFKTPIQASFYTMIFSQLTNLLLVYFLKQEGMFISLIFSNVFNCVFLFFRMKKKSIFSIKNYQKTLIKIFFSSLFMVFFLKFFLSYFIFFENFETKKKFFYLFSAIFLGIFVYFSVFSIFEINYKNFRN